MDIELNEDQRALADAVNRLVDRALADTTMTPQRYVYSPALQATVHEAGFFECMSVEELGPVGAAVVAMALCRLPQCVEMLGSAFVAPSLGVEASGPIAVLVDDAAGPIPFATVACQLIRLRKDGVWLAPLGAGDVSAVDSVFAYPMGVPNAPDELAWRELPNADLERAWQLWRVGMTAQIAGCLHAGLQSVLAHVRDRRQFGRPLGAFQAVQHRLAQCAVSIESASLLAFKAADSGRAADSLLALAYAQDIVLDVLRDLHQFMGAMGLTFEHPLQRWTYRARWLRAQAGGPAAHWDELAARAWTEPAAEEDPMEMGT